MSFSHTVSPEIDEISGALLIAVTVKYVVSKSFGSQPGVQGGPPNPEFKVKVNECGNGTATAESDISYISFVEGIPGQ